LQPGNNNLNPLPFARALGEYNGATKIGGVIINARSNKVCMDITSGLGYRKRLKK
jgi:hypothetical protein